MKSLILIISLVNLTFQLSAQEVKGVYIFTDRNLYVAGEKVFFAALVRDTSDTVFYTELVTGDGSQVAAGKFTISRANVSGSIIIPSGINTGNYYLRGYTREMRNAGPEAFGYKYLKIVNPYRNELSEASSSDEQGDSTSFSGTANLNLSIDKQEVTPGDSLEISISGIASAFKNLNVTIVPFFGSDHKVEVNDDRAEERYFSPENNGVIISGFVLDKISGKAIDRIRMNLSVMGEGRDFMTTETDDSGSFSFLLRGYNGIRDLFICTEKKEGASPRIYIDNDFYAIPVSIRSRRFTLTNEEREAAIKMAANFQVDSAFNNVPLQREVTVPENRALFYGTPDKSIRPVDFVKLPTIEEYFNELPSIVRVRKKDAKKYFKVIGTQAELTEMDPLVLVDMVPITDADKVLNGDPEKVEKIDIVNSVYVKGDMLFGGIISIISRKSDFARIDLPETGVFINYRFPELQSSNDNVRMPSTGNPDARNTLLWIPFFSLNEKNNLVVSAPDTPGNYFVIVRGVTTGNELFSMSKSFRVSGNREF